MPWVVPAGCPGLWAAFGQGCASPPGKFRCHLPSATLKGACVDTVNHLPKSITSRLLWTYRLTSKAPPQILGVEKAGLFFTTKETIPWEYCPWLGDFLVCPALLRSQQQENAHGKAVGTALGLKHLHMYTTKTAGKGQIETMHSRPGHPKHCPCPSAVGLQPLRSAQIPLRHRSKPPEHAPRDLGHQ